MADGVCLKVSKANYFAAAIHADGEEKGTRIIFQSLRMLKSLMTHHFQTFRNASFLAA